MRNVTPLMCVLLLFSIASCSRRPTDQRVARPVLLAQVASDEKASSDYPPPKTCPVTGRSVFARRVIRLDAAARTHLKVRNWRLASGKPTRLTLPSPALIKMRSEFARRCAKHQPDFKLDLGE
jgi:hypothetical protein